MWVWRPRRQANRARISPRERDCRCLGTTLAVAWEGVGVELAATHIDLSPEDRESHRRAVTACARGKRAVTPSARRGHIRRARRVPSTRCRETGEGGGQSASGESLTSGWYFSVPMTSGQAQAFVPLSASWKRPQVLVQPGRSCRTHVSQVFSQFALMAAAPCPCRSRICTWKMTFKGVQR